MKLPDQFAARLLDGLRSREREVLGLHFFDQFGVGDVAKLLGIKPGSASGHLSKGLSTVAKIVSGTTDEARHLLDDLGEVHARRLPKQVVEITSDEHVVRVGFLPHRQIMGAVVREDHTASDITAFFITEIDGVQVSVTDARTWYLGSLLALGLGVRKHLLGAKGFKDHVRFEDEASTYFFPFGYGCLELYYEQDFVHPPLTLPLPPGRSLLTHIPEMPPIDRRCRDEHLPDAWRLRVMDLGQYRKHYDDTLVADAEEGLRRRS